MMGMTHKAHCGLFLESLVSWQNCAPSRLAGIELSKAFWKRLEIRSSCASYCKQLHSKNEAFACYSIVFGTFTYLLNTGWMLSSFLNKFQFKSLFLNFFLHLLKHFPFFKTFNITKPTKIQKKLHKAPLVGSAASQRAVKCFFFYRRLSLR